MTAYYTTVCIQLCAKSFADSVIVLETPARSGAFCVVWYLRFLLLIFTAWCAPRDEISSVARCVIVVFITLKYWPGGIRLPFGDWLLLFDLVCTVLFIRNCRPVLLP